MKLLKGTSVLIRALEPEDLDFLYEIENDTEIWEISGTLAPYSRNVLREYLKNSHRDIYEVKQLRMAICDLNTHCLGLVDLYDFDPKNRRAGIGIVISAASSRNKGYGSEVLELICEYAFQVLDLHQLYAGVGSENTASLRLFEKLGFEQTGIKKDWIRTKSGFEDEVFMQKIREDVS